MLHNNLWNDEIYTLKKFTFVSLRQTLTDYHVPNNHILYNLFDQEYLRVIGITDMLTVLQKPEMLRLPLLLVSVIIIFFTYRAGKLAGGQATGLLAALLLVTAIPFQNFSLQVRGYTFSMLFDLLMVFYTLQYIFYRKEKYLLFIILATGAAMYTIPSNLYCVIGIIIFLSVELYVQKIANGIFDKKCFWPGAAVALGVLLAILCYVPVLHQVFSNDYVKGETSDSKVIIVQLLLLALNEFISGKEFFFFAAWSAIAIYPIIVFWSNTLHHATILKALLFQFITPALMVLVRGEQPPARVFAYLIPPVMVFTAVILVLVITRMLSLRNQHYMAWFLAVYILLAHRAELSALKAEMDFNLKNEIRTQGLYYHYYLCNYNPIALTSYLLKNAKDRNVPVVVRDCEPNDVTDYFNAFKIPYYPFDSLDYVLRQNKTAYVITRYPSQLDSVFSNEHHCAIKEVSEPTYNHVLKLRYQAQAEPEL